MENENKVIAGKQLITLVLKADDWEKTDKENILKQRVYDVYTTDENAQVYFGSDYSTTSEEKVREARELFDKLIRLTTWNGYIEAYIDISDIPELKNFPITIIQDRNEMKINANLEKEEKEKKDE